MIVVTWKDGFLSQSIRIEVRRRLEGGFLIVRAGAHVAREIVLEGRQAEALEAVLKQMPRLDSSSDIEDNLYDGEILEIEVTESGSQTIIGCSMKHRASFVEWYKRLEVAIRNW